MNVKNNTQSFVGFIGHEPVYERENSIIQNMNQIFTLSHESKILSCMNFYHPRIKYEIYKKFLDFVENVYRPVYLAGTNEFFENFQMYFPNLFQRLTRNYQSKNIIPVLTNAHHTINSLLDEEELVREVVSNKKYIERYLHISIPEPFFYFPPESVLFQSNLSVLKTTGIQTIITGDYVYRGVLPKDRTSDIFFTKDTSTDLFILQRNYELSHKIWRYIIGPHDPCRQDDRSLKKIDPKLVKKYKDLLIKSRRKIYFSDLEFMGFGTQAFDFLSQVFAGFSGKPPKEFQKDCKKARKILLPDFSWAGNDAFSRSDGGYPGIRTSSYQKIFQRYPDMLWRHGKIMKSFMDFLYSNVTITDKNLMKEIDFIKRIFSRACHFGWVPTVDMHKRAFLYFWKFLNVTGAKADISFLRLNLDDNRREEFLKKLDAFFYGLIAQLDGFITYRIKGFQYAVYKLEHRRDEKYIREILIELRKAKQLKDEAATIILQLRKKLMEHESQISFHSINENMLYFIFPSLEKYCLKVLQSLDCLNRVWKYDDHEMGKYKYAYLQTLSPKFVTIIKQFEEDNGKYFAAFFKKHFVEKSISKIS